jgi:REP element-mobilizing transposase RayT
MHNSAEIIYPTASTLKIRSRGFLPHWELDRGIYFVTFRLADSLPYSFSERLRLERERLLSTNDSKTPIMSVAAAHARLMRLADAELDRGLGACHLSDPRIGKLVQDSLGFRDGERHRLICWCVMPNHVHVVFQLFRGADLSALLHSWKSYTAHEANRLLGRTGAFWQKEYHDHVIRHDRELRNVVEYTVMNAEKAGLRNWPFAGFTTWWR